MALFESLFDVAYLIMVVSLGVRLLTEKKPGAKMFGIMAVLLGFGDAFHLVPRIMSHLSQGGFKAYESALSWGQFVTSITMTIFYVLYYYYYKRMSGKNIKTRDILIYVLAIARIVLVVMPQNGWGTLPGNYTFGILRNIPFAIMGALLIFWSWQDRDKAGLKSMAELIFFSFLFYIPVVLWAEKVPVVGALMMPKTVAYLLLVFVGYKHFVGEFKPINILKTSYVFLVMGLIGGVFYREFTKFNTFTDGTVLSLLHLHAIAVGFLGLSVLWLTLRHTDETYITKRIELPFKLYAGGLYFMIVTFVVRGISQIVGKGYTPFPDAALSGVAGIAHLILGVGIVWSVIIMVETVSSEKELNQYKIKSK